MIHSLTNNLLAVHELDIGVFRFYPNLVISEIKEGTVVTFEKALPLFSIGMEYYDMDTSLVYISDRKNSYSIDPTLHMEAKEIFSNLIGYGVVAYNEMSRKIAALEQKFVACPMGVFNSLDEAKIWAQDLLK
ncbi:hypothetical protein [Poritiphilus flavus]|uniref:STAS/SEC14 domain-containing protein n=1 Tax=Poritiphilus flavus TaxID=2697053 RepID=A0A6L9E7U7_9FLAO|nr:hypothetical protein [Poritiphilus flavus]NAS10806.1 hypothetical protein [Poritiphilus flavus]